MILDTLDRNPELAEELASIPFEFDVDDPDDDSSWIEFTSGLPFKIIAEDYCGGSYISVGNSDLTQNPIYHASSDAKVCRIGNNLQEALEHILTFLEFFNTQTYLFVLTLDIVFFVDQLIMVHL